MKTIPYLTCRGGVFYFRRVVPLNIRFFVGRREITKSLGTHDLKVARKAVIEMADELDKLFSKIQMGAELLSHSDLTEFSNAFCASKTEALLAEALVDFDDRQIEDEEWEALMKAIADRNAPIAECFFKGKAMGQQYAWLEANLVFEVARLLARMDVPALTVHDEFIVPVDMVEAVHEVRYTTAFQDVW